MQEILDESRKDEERKKREGPRSDSGSLSSCHHGHVYNGIRKDYTISLLHDQGMGKLFLLELDT